MGAHTDRHFGNVMVGPDSTLYHIDNDSAFAHDYCLNDPVYTIEPDGEYGEGEKDPVSIVNDTLHVDAANWLKSLDSRKLVSEMSKLGIDKNRIKRAVYALRTAQQHAAKNSTLDDMHEMINLDVG